MTPQPILMSVSMALALGACVAEPDDELEPDDRDAQVLEIIENLELAGYPSDSIEVDEDDVVIVGGDAVVTLEASREIAAPFEPADGDDHEFRQWRTYGLVSGSVDTICIDGTAFLSHTFLLSGLVSAVDRYNALNLSFDMALRFYGNTSGCDAVIVSHTQYGTGGKAGFPSGGMPYNKFYIGIGVNGYGTAVASHLIEHELGHCIGLRHSDWYNRWSCGGEPAEPTALLIPGTPVFDANSVMNACYDHNVATGVWTAGDVLALQTLY